MANDTEYRVVIDPCSNDPIGVVRIDLTKWGGEHWIVDPDGDERKLYPFRSIDSSKYDTAVAFETHPVLEVRYKKYLRVFEDKEDIYGSILFVAGSFAIAVSYILGTVIMFSDLAPVLGNSLWYQIGYWAITLGTVVGGVGILTTFLCNHLISNPQTKKDILIEKWLKFKIASEEESAPDV